LPPTYPASGGGMYGFFLKELELCLAFLSLEPPEAISGQSILVLGCPSFTAERLAEDENRTC